MPIHLATKGPKAGRCNICGEFGPLTEDHTPPKGCYLPTAVVIRHISTHISAEKKPSRGRMSQNGVKYRTLCHRCNNTMLGSNYDPHFIAFVNSVGNHLRSPQLLPSRAFIRGRPQAILRSLVGHIAAQGVARYLKGPLTEAIRDYFLNESLPFPTGLSAFYWAFPFQSHVMARDVAFLDFAHGEPFSMWFLKFFPVAFMITWDRPRGFEYPTETFDPWRSLAIDQEVEMPLGLSRIPHQLWPETPTDRSILLYGPEAVHVNLR